MKFIHSDYKTIQLSLYMIAEDDVKKRAYRFLLPKMLVSHTNSLTTKQKMAEYLQSLYGATLGGRTSFIGNLNVMYLGLAIVNPKIIDEPTLVDDVIELFKDLLTDRDLFSASIFEDEKRMLIEQWESIEDQKSLYASVDFKKHFYKDHAFGYPQSGHKEDIEMITLEGLYQYFLEVLETNKMYFIINGYLNGYEDKFKSGLSYLENQKEINFRKQTLKEETPNQIESHLDMNQAIIKIGYHMPIYRNDPLYEALLCFDLMLGGYVESLLFKIIREELGLCYDIRSSFDPTQGVLVISSGVDQKRKDEALNKIFDIISNVERYGFNEQALVHAKQYLVHQIKSSYDEQNTLTIRQFYRDIFQDSYTLEDRIKRIHKVQYEEVMEVYSKLILQTTYVLTGDKHDH